MTHTGICHPLAPFFGERGRYQVGTYDPVHGEHIAWTDDLDEAVEVLWTHYQLDRRADRYAMVAVWDSETMRTVHHWNGGRVANQSDLHPLSKLVCAILATGRPVLIS